MLRKLSSLVRPRPLLHFHHHIILFCSSETILPQQHHQDQEEEEEEEEEKEKDAVLSSIFNQINSSVSVSIASLLPSFTRDPSLLDQLLKRARFSHSNPLPVLHLFRSLLSTDDDFTPSPSSLNTLLYILARSRHFHLSWALLRLIKHRRRELITPATLQVFIARVAKTCSVRQTVDCFHQFKKLLRPFDVTCYNALLRTLVQERRGSMTDARNVYHSLKYEFKPDLQTFNILLSGWKSVQDAESFFAEMTELGVKPDLVTFNCLIDVYCKNREVDKARKVFDRMREEGIEPDVISYTSLIGGLGLIGQPDKARDLLNEMRELGCRPDVAAYNAAIRNYCIAKRLPKAFALMEEMGRRGLAPNATSYNLFFRVFYWANELENAWRLYRGMKAEGCLPNVQSCMFLVRLCRRNEKVEMGLELWGDMVERGFGSFVLVSDVLFDLLCDWGKLDEVARCFEEMVQRGQKPSNLSFRRIKVLMELANRHESARNMSEKMARFAGSAQGRSERVILREGPVDFDI